MEKRVLDDFQSQEFLQYYVAKQNSTLSRISGHCDVNVSTLRLGMLVRCLEDFKDGTLRIAVTDVSGSNIWFNTEWRCQKDDLILVSQEIWRFLLAVSVPQERVRLANDKSLCGLLEKLCINDKVWYCSNFNGYKELAIIKYIGLVPELGKGLYFGLDLPGSQEPSKPFMLCQEYFESMCTNRTFATLNQISPYKTDVSIQSAEKILLPKPITNNTCTNEKKKCTLEPSLLAMLETFSFDDSNNNNKGNHVSLPNEHHYVMKPLIPPNTDNKIGNTDNNRSVKTYSLFKKYSIKGRFLPG